MRTLGNRQVLTQPLVRAPFRLLIRLILSTASATPCTSQHVTVTGCGIRLLFCGYQGLLGVCPGVYNDEIQ